MRVFIWTVLVLCPVFDRFGFACMYFSDAHRGGRKKDETLRAVIKHLAPQVMKGGTF